MKLKLYTDGGSRGNPGPAAYGYAVFASHTGTDFPPIKSSSALAASSAVIILDKCGKYLGTTTNNQAEYEGLINGLKWIAANRVGSSVDIYMDSLLIVNQVKGLYKIKSQELLPKNLEVRELLTRFPSYTINYVPRADNSVADALVNDALDKQLA